MSNDANIQDGKGWCVYCHTSPSGKKYIGITSKEKPEYRWGKNGKRYLEQENGKYRHPAMANALLKYPNWDEWQHDILFQGLTKEDAEYIEKDLIKTLNTRSYKYGYNCTDGGEGASGLVISEEAKEKMSKKAKERYKDKTNHPMYGVHRYGEENPFYGKSHTDSSKEKMSETHKGIYDGDKNPMYGKQHSKETREKMSRNHADFSHEKHPRSVPIYCIELNEIFWGATDAQNKYGIDYRTISACCRHKEGFNSAGKHPDIKIPLHWLYTSEAIKNGYVTQQEIDDYFNNLKNKGD